MVRRLENWLILLSGWQRGVVTWLAGCISALAMAPFDAFYILFFTIPILIWLMDGVSSEADDSLWSKFKEGFKPGFFFGFGYFLSGLWWIGNAFLIEDENFLWALPIAVISLPMILAIFWGMATAFARFFWSGDIARVFALATGFMIFEYLRSFIVTGFPWNAVAYAAYFTPLTMQSASVLGLYAMTPFVIIVAAVAVFIFPDSGERRLGHHLAIGFCISLAVLHVGFGAYRLETADQGMVEDVRLRLVQPAIDQEKKFVPGKDREILQTYLDLSVSRKNGAVLSEITHLIWPESALPFLLTERRDALSAIAAMLPEGTSLVIGAVRTEQGTNDRQSLLYNSVYVIDSDGMIVSGTDKVHLVPFGEYLPFQTFLESLGIEQLTRVKGGFSAGNSRNSLSTGIGPAFLPLICYEIIFSGQLWDKKDKRSGWILNLTNDAWFGITPGPYQHERQALLRAVEEGLPVIRAANSGISGVYDAYGRQVARLELGQKGILDTSLPMALAETVFSGFGNSIFWITMLVFAIIGINPLRKFKI